MRRSVRLLVGCGLLMAGEAAVMPSAAPALIPSIWCVCIFDGVLNAFRHSARNCETKLGNAWIKKIRSQRKENAIDGGWLCRTPMNGMKLRGGGECEKKEIKRVLSHEDINTETHGEADTLDTRFFAKDTIEGEHRSLYAKQVLLSSFSVYLGV